MPELPDIELYIHALDARIRGNTLKNIRIANPFLVRSVEPPIDAAIDRRVRRLRRVGKRIAIGLESDYWLVLHLMIAGRLQWLDDRPVLKSKTRLASFDFDNGSVLLTEAGSKKRASLHLVHGEAALAQHDPGGIEPLRCSQAEFFEQLSIENRTLKRMLTDPRRFSGIGNAYSDEILHAARLSPVKLTSRLTEAEKSRLFDATRQTLEDWTARLLEETGDAFPARVTAFKQGMAVHGRFGKPCPVCGATVQRIRYKSRETNYCAVCQTGGKLLADRSLSRLLKDDWPDAVDEPAVR